MARGLMQEDAAQWFGVYRRTIVDWEAGRCVPKSALGVVRSRKTWAFFCVSCQYRVGSGVSTELWMDFVIIRQIASFLKHWQFVPKVLFLGLF